MIQVKDANTKKLNEITSSYLEEFQDKETRHIYTDEFLNAKIATQIRVLREAAGLSQEELAEKSGMRQERICVLEDVNYSAWTLSTLRRLAEVFDLRINVSFEDFGSFLDEFANFSKESLERVSFKDDPIFGKNTKVVRKQVFYGGSDITLHIREGNSSQNGVPKSKSIKQSDSAIEFLSYEDRILNSELVSDNACEFGVRSFILPPLHEVIERNIKNTIRSAGINEIQDYVSEAY
jgi:transcriptional regulator with XRE-family HTH domain